MHLEKTKLEAFLLPLAFHSNVDSDWIFDSECQQYYLFVDDFTPGSLDITLKHGKTRAMLDDVIIENEQDLPKLADMLRRNDYGPAIRQHRIRILHALRASDS